MFVTITVTVAHSLAHLPISSFTWLKLPTTKSILQENGHTNFIIRSSLGTKSVLNSSNKEFYLQLTRMHKRSFKLTDEYALSHTL